MFVRLFVRHNTRGQITVSLKMENAPSAIVRTTPQKHRARILWWEEVQASGR